MDTKHVVTTRKMIALYVVLLLVCADAKKKHPNAAKKHGANFVLGANQNENPYTDPEADIPEFSQFEKQFPVEDEASSKEPVVGVPRDRYEQWRRKSGHAMTADESQTRARMWLDFEAIHDKVIQEQNAPGAKPASSPFFSKKLVDTHKFAPQYDKRKDFEQGGFGFKGESLLALPDRSPINWTTCDEFKKGSEKYNPEDIVNINWIPFYVWTDRFSPYAFLHSFKPPTQEAVHKYYTKFKNMLNNTLDWHKPKLLLSEDKGRIQYLLIAADSVGLYHLIVDMELPDYVLHHNVTLPSVTVRLKIVDPYLAMMYCEDHYATIMARVGYEPPTRKARKRASNVLNFRGTGRPVKRNLQFERERDEMEKLEKELTEKRNNLPTNLEEDMFPPPSPRPYLRGQTIKVKRPKIKKEKKPESGEIAFE